LKSHDDYAVLDVSNPAALQWIEGVYQNIQSWGYDLVKEDFLYAGAIDALRYNPSMTGEEAYNLAFQSLAQVLESNPNHPIYILSSGAPVAPNRWAHSWRASRDIEDYTAKRALPSWATVQGEMIGTANEWFVGPSLAAPYADDAVIEALSGSPKNLTTTQAQALVTMDVLNNALFLDGDDLTTLTPDRMALLTNPGVLSVLQQPLPGVPVTLVNNAGPNPPPLLDRANASGTHFDGLFNWSANTSVLTLAFSAIGLSSTAPYDVYDLWNQQDLGTYMGSFSATLQPYQPMLVRIQPAS